jgi:hypothetical protein
VKNKIGIAFGISCILIIAGALFIYRPFKVTDPSDPRFNPDSFSFSDYASGDELDDAFRQIFPIGTPKSFVDQVLVDAGNARQSKDKTYKFLVYYWEPWRFHLHKPPHYNFTFDENEKLLNINAVGKKLYREQPNYVDLHEDGDNG